MTHFDGKERVEKSVMVTFGINSQWEQSSQSQSRNDIKLNFIPALGFQKLNAITKQNHHQKKKKKVKSLWLVQMHVKTKLKS